MRYKITLEYDGTKYKGWQMQAGQRTLQGELVDACRRVFGTDQMELSGSGRTDAGVHALGQVIHLEVKTSLIPEHILQKLNDELPADVSVLSVEKSHPRFHARHDASARSYVYIISRRRSAFGKRTTWWVKDQLNVAAMRKAAGYLAGFHDFRSFTDESAEQKSTTVQMEFVDVHEQGDQIIIHLVASHYLWKMVRRIVGVLVEVGKGKLRPEIMLQWLDEHSREPAKLTAPPSGLFLERVYYRNEVIVRGEWRKV